MAVLSLVSSLAARAEGKVDLDEGGRVVDADDAAGGMSSSNPRVKSILAAHPGQYVVVCVAGCNGKPHAVQVLPRPVTARVGEFLPSAAKIGKETYGPPRPAGFADKTAGTENDVLCLAGCSGRPGQVVDRIADLPPPSKAVPKARKDKRNEPLDVDP
jgi:hypothetical protein